MAKPPKPGNRWERDPVRTAPPRAVAILRTPGQLRAWFFRFSTRPMSVR
ncbi:UNVERIFIED_CONTAM: hypothetical protein Q9R58_07625 [Methylobacteriaceae bacterium AG10]|nr:hypothetical protein [Methylobacteriaceae bacterium AG10]